MIRVQLFSSQVAGVNMWLGGYRSAPVLEYLIQSTVLQGGEKSAGSCESGDLGGDMLVGSGEERGWALEPGDPD